jgi:sulfide:quinone oxidoreductase
MSAVPGLSENSYTITTLPDAQRAREGWQRFLDDPGDVVVGATQGAGCFGAAYEYLFNVAYRLKKSGLRGRVRLHYVTSEPFLGHFGIGGLRGGEPLLKMFLHKEGIEAHVNVGIDSVEPGMVRLADGTEIPAGYAMIVPPFLGQEFLSRTEGLVTPKGYVRVRDTYQSADHDNLYAVGIAADVPVPWQTQVPTSLPKTGFPTERMAHVAATNIASQVRGEQPTKTKAFADIPAVCVMDAGNNGVMILADKMLPPRKAGALVPGPQNHAVKVGLEKYFLWKNRKGYVSLP